MDRLEFRVGTDIPITVGMDQLMSAAGWSPACRYRLLYGVLGATRRVGADRRADESGTDRLSKVVLLTGEGDINYAYDTAGRLQTVTGPDPAGTLKPRTLTYGFPAAVDDVGLRRRAAVPRGDGRGHGEPRVRRQLPHGEAAPEGRTRGDVRLRRRRSAHDGDVGHRGARDHARPAEGRARHGDEAHQRDTHAEDH